MKLSHFLAAIAMTSSLALAAGDVKQMPSFQFPDLDGKIHSSKEFQGKYVMLDFWATWCTTCRTVIKGTQELRSKIDTTKLAVVGISIDKADAVKVKAFAKKMKMDWMILLDPENTMAPQLGFEAVPSVFLFAPDGKLVTSMLGFDADKEKELMAKIEASIP